MPGFDKTGPNGEGLMTGRGLGPCGGGEAFRWGCGRGYRRRRFAVPTTFTKEEKIKILEAEKEKLEKNLKELKDN